MTVIEHWALLESLARRARADVEERDVEIAKLREGLCKVRDEVAHIAGGVEDNDPTVGGWPREIRFVANRIDMLLGDEVGFPGGKKN